jgi:uncharacterized protein
MKRSKNKKIWIDLDNSPHVPFFKPIIPELEKRGYPVIITIRDCSQTQQMADLFRIPYKKVGKHYGKNKIVKVLGTLFRSVQLLSYVRRERPFIAVSHGSRAQLFAAKASGIPTLGIIDYEHAEGVVQPTWLMFPEVISKSKLRLPPDRLFSYPGIKEDAYVPFFSPDDSILADLNIPNGHLITVIRPPAVAAHYHNPESEILFEATISFLAAKKNVAMIILPRYETQGNEIKTRYTDLTASRQIIIPDKVYDGLNLMWFADFVVSGGGTMNREAAALGVPVYSIFRGKIGAVDRYLSDEGRLVLLRSVDDVQNKIKVEKRKLPAYREKTDNRTLNSIVETIVKLVEGKR